ncbi:MAG: PilZ domain-containing protein [Deltaproteobacteria bacterium]|nr:PilZ domain-containing protein [Deltaproteobacteria bacterium]
MHRKLTSERGCIASYVGPRAFAPQTRAALGGLGYQLIPAFAMGRFDDPSWRTDLRLVDERQYSKIPSEAEDPETPVILMTGLRPLAIKDGRIVGRVGRPVELQDLYPLIQRAMEMTPRAVPRVATQLAARCIRRDQRSVGHVVSLSAGGCLFRSRQSITEGTRMNLQFALPSEGIVSTRAECIHQGRAGVGLRFSGAPTEVRQHIANFVARRLATA